MSDSKKIPNDQLRIAYSEIVSGISIFETEQWGDIYVKHLGIMDTTRLDRRREVLFLDARKKGLPTNEQKIELLTKEGLWSKEKEEELRKEKDFIARMGETKQKLILKSEVERMEKEIQKAQHKVKTIYREKVELIGLTAELFADKKVNDYYIFLTLYKNPEFTESFFSEEEFDELNDTELAKIISAYNVSANKFSDINMKRIALSPFFLNNYHLCKDNPFIFFGKPIVELTYHQSDLFANGRYFKHIISEFKHTPPPEVMEDPDKLINAFNLQQNKEKMDDGKDKTGVASTVVGATKDDLEALGMSKENTTEGEVVDLNEEMRRKGGTLDMEDLIKLHGI